MARLEQTVIPLRALLHVPQSEAAAMSAQSTKRAL